jgi:hypothetical protein
MACLPGWEVTRGMTGFGSALRGCLWWRKRLVSGLHEQRLSERLDPDQLLGADPDG